MGRGLIVGGNSARPRATVTTATAPDGAAADSSANFSSPRGGAGYSVQLDKVPEQSRVLVMSTLRNETKASLSTVMRMLNTPGGIVASGLAIEVADQLVDKLSGDGATAIRIDG